MGGRLSAISGMLSGAVVVTGLLVLTWASWDWLAAAGWSPLARNQVQWPSVLLLGPWGRVMAAVLVGSAIFAAGFVGRLRAVASPRAAAALALAAVFLALTAVPPIEEPVAFPLVRMHNAAYLGLLGSWWGSVAFCWTDIRGSGYPNGGTPHVVHRLAVACIVPILAGMLLGLVPATGQLARYLLLFPMAVWLAGVAWFTRSPTGG